MKSMKASGAKAMSKGALLKLHAAEAWKSEDACLLDLLCGNSHEAVQDVGAILGLHLILSRKQLKQGTLRHSLCTAGLHRLHGLFHGSHVHSGRGVKSRASK